MAIESIIELKVQGLDELEERLNALRNISLDMGMGGMPGAPSQRSAAQTQTVQEANKSLYQFSRSVNSATDTVGKLSSSFLKLSKSIIGTGGLISGIASMATLAGIIRNASAIGQRNIAGTGLGLASPNALGALQSTYGAFGGVEGRLGAIQTQMNTLGSPAPAVLSQIINRYSGRSYSPDQLRRMDPQQRFLLINEALMKAEYDRNPQVRMLLRNPDTLAQLGLEGVTDVQTQERLKMLGPEGLSEIERIRRERQPLTEMDQSTAFQWQMFGAKRELGLKGIETQFTKLLTPMLNPLDRVFKALAHSLGEGSGGFGKVVSYAARKIDEFAVGLETGNWSAFWESLKKDGQAAMEAIRPYAEDAWEWVKDKSTEAWDWIRKEFPPLAKQAWDEISKYFKENFPEATSEIKTLVDSFKDLYQAAMDVADMFRNINEALSWKFMGEEDGGLIGGFASSFSDKFKDVTDVVSVAEKYLRTNTEEGFGKIGRGVSKAANWTSEKLGMWNPIIEKASAKFGVEEDLIKAVMFAESSGNPNATSQKGAGGLMQLTGATAERFGVSNRYDPEQNIMGGTAYLGYLLKLFKGDTKLALAAYNAGEGNVKKYGNKIPPFKETQDYVERVMSGRSGFQSVAEQPMRTNERSIGFSAGPAIMRAYPRVVLRSEPGVNPDYSIGFMSGSDFSGNQSKP